MTEQVPQKDSVALSDLDIGYNPDSPLIRSAFASVGNGELVALIGENGSGKSTLIKTAAGLFRSLRGELIVNNEKIDDLNISERARIISYVAAGSVETVNLSVFELVALGRLPHTNWIGNLSERDRHIIEDVLNQTGLYGFENRKVYNLSDGERQRAMIARALVQDTPILLLDEPTAFLDLPNKYELIRMLERLRRNGKSVLFSTHDIETAILRADKLWVIHNRSLIEGSPEDLGMKGIFNELFRDSGVVFNKMDQRFENPEEPVNTVHFNRMESDIHLWTSRALTRAGFRQTTENRGEVEITISENGGEICWSILRNNEVIHCYSLYDLIKYLIQS